MVIGSVELPAGVPEHHDRRFGSFLLAPHQHGLEPSVAIDVHCQGGKAEFVDAREFRFDHLEGSVALVQEQVAAPRAGNIVTIEAGHLKEVDPAVVVEVAPGAIAEVELVVFEGKPLFAPRQRRFAAFGVGAPAFRDRRVPELAPLVRKPVEGAEAAGLGDLGEREAAVVTPHPRGGPQAVNNDFGPGDSRHEHVKVAVVVDVGGQDRFGSNRGCFRDVVPGAGVPAAAAVLSEAAGAPA